MASKERMVLLYQETENKRNKEKIFREIWEGLEREAYSVCHYYYNFIKNFRDNNSFLEDAIQESKLCLVRCIDKFNIKKNTSLSTFYRTCLQNHIYNVYKDYINISRNEFIDTSAFNWLNNDVEDNLTENIDNKALYDLFDKHLDKIHYTKPIHKDIFKDYVEFSDTSSLKESFGSLGEKYKLSRMAIKKIVDKYFELLRNSLEQSGDLDKVKEYL